MSDELFGSEQIPTQTRVVCPPKKARKPVQLVTFPDTLPDDWRLDAVKLRPDIDPELVFRKLRARYLSSPKKKALYTWKREFMNWVAGERAKPIGYQQPASQQALQQQKPLVSPEEYAAFEKDMRERIRKREEKAREQDELIRRLTKAREEQELQKIRNGDLNAHF